MSKRFFFRSERYIYANPYCFYNVYIKLKYVIPSVKNATLSLDYIQRRQFHVTSRNFMNAPIENNMKVDPNDPLITKIRSDPQILASIQEFSQLLQGKGVDLSTGQMPSMIQLAKLATDKEVNAKITTLNSQLTKAGITLDTQTVQKFMTNWADTEKASEPNIPQIPTQKSPKQVIPSTPKVEESKVATAKAPAKQAEPKVIKTADTVKQAAKATKEQQKQPPIKPAGFIAKIKSWILREK